MQARFFIVAFVVFFAAPLRASVVPEPTKLPDYVSLEDALAIFRQRGFDLLLADAAVYNAEGEVRAAGFVPNPNVSYSFAHIFNYDPAEVCPPNMSGFGGAAACSPNVHNITLSDNAAIEDTLSGKRYLRLKTARTALAAAKMARVDAQRTLEFQIKEVYITAVLARDALDFALEVKKGWEQTSGLQQVRYQKGAISEVDAAKVEITKLEADQAVNAAEQALRVAKVSLAFLLGVRGPVPDFKVEQDLPKFVVSQRLDKSSPAELISEAFERRPDLRAAALQRQRSEAALSLAKRLRFPDLDLQIGFAYAAPAGGAFSSNTTPPTLIVGVTGNIPLFYQQQGEIKKAEADVRTQQLSRAKVEAQVVSDVETAYANFSTFKKLVERMEARLLERARFARDGAVTQFQKGSASLLEMLDAQRTFINTNIEYLNDLASYWNAVFQLEQAVGMNLR